MTCHHCGQPIECCPAQRCACLGWRHTTRLHVCHLRTSQLAEPAPGTVPAQPARVVA